MRLARVSIFSLAVAFAALAGCDKFRRPELVLPTSSEAEAAFNDYPDVTGVRLSGNVVEIVVEQPVDHVQRGGSLWARFGPYTHLFSPASQALFTAYNGIAALRVITQLPNGTEIARATLHRDSVTLNVWRRGEAMLASALSEGTTRPSLVEQFVHWAEGVTEYEYNPRYVTNSR
ncbi:MAG TPA: hypothetical protein VNZ57_03380 [Longimicrobiales bacterium]|nr:hypothetical protein [Longimicrobiales bacterium]